MQSSYSTELVVLSYIVAVLASRVTLSLAERLRPWGGGESARRGSFWPWIVGGAFSMGTGIWSMHFIGMLAFHLPVRVAYDLPLTTTSWAIAVVVSGFALHRFHRNDTTVRGIGVPGVFMGVGISAMHYTGMAAMRMFPMIGYDPLLFVTSVLIAIGASIVALWIAFSMPYGHAGASWHKMAAAAVMGAAIVGMHYTGMTAAHFAPNAVCISSGPRLDAGWLALTIAMFTFLILGSTLLLSVIDAQLQSTIASSAEALRTANEELEHRVRDRTAQLQSANLTLQSEIEARQRTEQRLRESHGLLQTVIDNSKAVVYVKDLEGRFVLVNRRFEEIFGLAREVILGRTDHDFFPQEVAEAFRKVDLQVVEADRAVTEEEKVPQTDGPHTYISVKAPLRDAVGRISGIFGISTDITERKRDEEQLRSQLARLRLLDETTRAIGERRDLQSLFQVVLRNLEEHLPVDFGCVCVNDSVQRMWTVACVGARSRVLLPELGLPDQASIGVDENGLGRCLLGQLVYEPDISCSAFPLIARLGSVGLRALVFAPLIVEGNVVGVMIAARRAKDGFASGDCDFLRQLSGHVALAAHQSQLYGALHSAYEELRQTQQTALQQERLRALGQMASGVAHDINNALTPATLYLHSLLDQEDSLGAQAREDLLLIKQAMEDVANTVARLREFYRPRGTQLALAPMDLNKALRQAIDLTQARWSDMPQERGFLIRVRDEVVASLPVILGAENEVRDALVNLVLNAVDAMPEGGTLTLRSRPLDTTRVLVEVSDTGIGMSETVRNRCLEPFFTTKGERGTGLGLAMVYGMIQRHNGALEIRSEPGAGTTVCLTFPVAEAQAAPAGSSGARPFEGLRILIVDDDPQILRSLRRTLERDGHEVEVAHGGQAGIDRFRADQRGGAQLDLVISDLGMPHVDGRTLATAIKACDPGMPVVLLTGWGYRLKAEDDVPEHVDCVLSKPPTLQELRAALADLTGKRMSTRSVLANTNPHRL